MDESKDIIKREIAFYMAFDPYYIKYFKESSTAGMVQLCIGVTLQHPAKDRLISGFIAGLALLPIAHKTGIKEYMKEAKELLKPVVNLIFRKGYESDYRKLLTESLITGKSIIDANGVITPITADEILTFNKRTNGRLLTPHDVDKREREFIEFRKKQSPITAAPMRQTSHPKATKPFTQYFAQEYRETLPEALKLEFAGDVKTTLAILIHTLRFEFDIKYLIVNSGEMKDFHLAMAEYFDGTDIGDRTNYNKDKSLYEKGDKQTSKVTGKYYADMLNCKTRIESLLQNIDI